MKRILIAATLVLAASPTLSQRYESGTPEARSAALLAAIEFVRKSCPALEIDLDVAARAGTATGINPPDKALNVARSDTVAELLAGYDRDPKNSCNAVLLDYGPSGHSVRGMIYYRQ